MEYEILSTLFELNVEEIWNHQTWGFNYWKHYIDIATNAVDSS
jgi:hypothetical protein